jgi:hypothetical protein
MSDDVPAVKRGGRRPKHGIAMTETLTFRMTPTMFDRLCSVARGRRMELRDLVRELVERGIGISYPEVGKSERVM